MSQLADHSERELGGLFLANTAVAIEACRQAKLRPADFLDRKVRMVAEAAKRLHAKGAPVDTVSLADALGDRKLEAIGGLPFLAELVALSTFGSDPVAQAHRVREAARARRLRSRTSEIAAKEDAEADDLLGELSHLVRAEAPQAEAPVTAVALADVQPERVRWLWPGRIALGKICVLDGDPGLGKSSLSLAVAAAVTTGRAVTPGDEPVPQGAVLLLTAEDGLGDTIRPRLEAAGADVARVFALPEVPGSEGPRPPVLPDDVGLIEKVIAELGVVLVVIDPIMAFLGGSVDAHRDQDVRRVLSALAKVAERTGAAVLLVRHLRKGAGSAVHAGGGSIGIIGAARTGLLVARDPDDPGARILAVTKCNLAAEPPALRYRLVDGGSGVAHVEWVPGSCDHRADDLVAASHQRHDEEPGALDEAVEFLKRILASGPVPARDLEKARRAEQIAERTMKRARQKLGVTAHQAKREWFVSLPWPPGTVAPWHSDGPLTDDDDGRDDSQSANRGPGGQEAAPQEVEL